MSYERLFQNTLQ